MILDGAAEAQWRRVFGAFVGAYLAVCVATSIVSSMAGASPKLITGDAVGYYSWLRSSALDRDFDFANDYQLLYPPDPIPEEHQRRTKAELPSNKYPPALAIVEIPGFAVGHLIALATTSPADGASAPYQLGVTVWLQLVIVAGFVALWLALARLGAEPRISTLLIGCGLVGTNLVNYVAKETAMAHGAGTALLCFALYAIVRAERSNREVRWLAAAGVFYGLAIVIRPTNSVFVLFLAPWLLPRIKHSMLNAVVIGGPVVVLVLMHVVLTSILFGGLTFSGYEGESFTAGLQGLGGSLFSSRHGLFVYTPWYLLMIAMCAAATRVHRTRAAAWVALGSFVLLWIANGTWWNWWFGSGFGNRAFIESIPVLIVAVALWLSELRITPRRLVRLASVMAALGAVNLYLWLGYMLQRFPSGGLHTVAEAYFWPIGR